MTRPERLQAEATRTSYRRAFTQGVVINIFNPKVALFFLSFLPQFIERGHGPTWLQSLIFGSLFVLLGFVTDGSWALLASAVRGMLLRGKAMPFIRRWVSGSMFVGLASGRRPRPAGDDLTTTTQAGATTTVQANALALATPAVAVAAGTDPPANEAVSPTATDTRPLGLPTLVVRAVTPAGNVHPWTVLVLSAHARTIVAPAGAVVAGAV